MHDKNDRDALTRANKCRSMLMYVDMYVMHGSHIYIHTGSYCF